MCSAVAMVTKIFKKAIPIRTYQRNRIRLLRNSRRVSSTDTHATSHDRQNYLDPKNINIKRLDRACTCILMTKNNITLVTALMSTMVAMKVKYAHS